MLISVVLADHRYPSHQWVAFSVLAVASTGGRDACGHFAGGFSSSGGFYSLQVEDLLVPPKRVWLRNFRTAEAVTLADL